VERPLIGLWGGRGSGGGEAKQRRGRGRGRAHLSARGRGSAGRTVVLSGDVALMRFLGVEKEESRRRKDPP
jgi:hypothetical protein